MKKRLLAMASAAVMFGLLSLMAVPSSSLSAGAAESQTYGDLTYKNYGGWIEITDCNTSVVSVEIPDKIDGKTVRDIGDNAFSGCSALEQITIPDCVENIKKSAFNGCKNLTAIDLPDKLKTIGLCAFANCGFTEITIPESVVTIERLAFTVTPITTITIPKNVETIGEGAFTCGSYGSGTLTKINVDAENTSFIVKDGVLLSYDQTELLCCPAAKEDKDYTMPKTVTTLYTDSFNGCTNIEQITISNNVTLIPERAFCDCVNLKEVTIPNSVTQIDKTAFAGDSQLTSVYLPKSVEQIKYQAFGYCTSLTDVYYAGTEDEWNAIDNDDNWLIKANIHYNYNGNIEKIKGDVNADGTFSVADVILLQKWLLTVPDTHLANWKAADFCEDGKLNVFDLCMMKRELLNQKPMLSDYISDFASLHKMPNQIIVSRNQALIRFDLMVQVAGDVISEDTMEWELSGSADADYISGVFRDTETNPPYYPVSSYCLITANGLGTIEVTGTEKRANGEKVVTIRMTFNVNENGEIDSNVVYQ